MAVSQEFLDYVLEQLSGLGAIRHRRMFGGVGLYCGELFFGLIDNDTLFLKVDDLNRPDFDRRGMPPFRPYPDRPDASIGYRQAPAEVVEDAETLVVWAGRSVEVAAAAKKPKAGKKGTKASGRRKPPRS